jgi:hypothetical protein
MDRERNLIKLLYNKVDTAYILDEIAEIGEIRTSYNENITVFESNHELFDTVIITDMPKSKMKKISFAGDFFSINLNELKILFGAYEMAYNFRDNYTGFFFLNAKGKKINKVYCEKENNIIIEQGKFSEYSPKSKLVEALTEKEIVMNNIIFEVNY